ncbi:Ribonuclease P protein subunit p30 [Coccomyxa sp. Obi]|nr:Ribonuclease P protein subunit p30 [Coccomyxa sp. Obi]
MAVRLGYDCVATSHIAADRLIDKDRCTQRPLEAATLAAAGPGVTEALRCQQGLIRDGGAAPRQLLQVSRLTVAVEEAAAAAQLLGGPNPITASYDLLAVQPLSERVFQQACTTLVVDVITFDMARRLPFRLWPGPLQAAVKRGVHLEICYSAALRDETSRRNFFSNASALVRAARGHGIIVSSGARTAFELRGPYDVMNLVTLCGLTEQQAKAAMSERCRQVARHAEIRKAHKGAVTVIKESAEGGGEESSGRSAPSQEKGLAPAAALKSVREQAQQAQPMKIDRQQTGKKTGKRRRR